MEHMMNEVQTQNSYFDTTLKDQAVRNETNLAAVAGRVDAVEHALQEAGRIASATATAQQQQQFRNSLQCAESTIQELAAHSSEQSQHAAAHDLRLQRKIVQLEWQANEEANILMRQTRDFEATSRSDRDNEVRVTEMAEQVHNAEAYVTHIRRVESETLEAANATWAEQQSMGLRLRMQQEELQQGSAVVTQLASQVLGAQQHAQQSDSNVAVLMQELAAE